MVKSTRGGITKLDTYFWSYVGNQKSPREHPFWGCLGDQMDTFGPSFDPPPETLSFPRASPLKIPWETPCGTVYVQYGSHRPKIQGKWGFSTIFGLFWAILGTFSPIWAQWDFFKKIGLLSLFYLYCPLTSPEKPEQSHDPIPRTLRHARTDARTHPRTHERHFIEPNPLKRGFN